MVAENHWTLDLDDRLQDAVIDCMRELETRGMDKDAAACLVSTHMLANCVGVLCATMGLEQPTPEQVEAIGFAFTMQLSSIVPMRLT